MASALTFRTAALKEAAQTIIDNADALTRQWEIDAAALASQHRLDWIENGGFERLRELRDMLTKAIKRTDPVTTSKVRSALHVNDTENIFYSPMGDYAIRQEIGYKPDPVKTTNYRALIALLDAHTEDTITANQLKVAGFSDLHSLFRIAQAVAQ